MKPEKFLPSTTPSRRSAPPMRPEVVRPLPLGRLNAVLQQLGLPPMVPAPGAAVDWELTVTGLSIDSRAVEPGDLYVALPGARAHGAQFAAVAAAAGAAAMLTDEDGARLAAAQDLGGLPVLLARNLRALVGPLSAAVFDSQPGQGPRPVLFGVTGTNGKTTTTYFVNSLLRALGRTTGLIGTIEILAGGEPVPSALTTPESPQVHGILALMRERGLDAAAMEVSSHAVSYRRVDGVVYDVAGFTNLTQDHLDLHGSMDEYFETKAELFTPARARRAVVCVDDAWGRTLAARLDEGGAVPVLTLSTAAQPATGPETADWSVQALVRDGLGHRFELHGPEGARLRLRTGLPGTFNVANAALAAVMVLASGVEPRVLQQACDAHDPFTIEVPGRMQLVGRRPAAIVDFAHNPDALERTISSVRTPGTDARVIVVFGATGERDAGKRPLMGAIAARLADVVVVTDDDPHGEDPAAIRREVMAGALAARQQEQLATEILEVFPRAAAIERAVALAGPADTVLVAGRGHEVWQDVNGENLAFDDRVELREALRRHGFEVAEGDTVKS
ncbi:UDP-N-acetylmuramoyl-L-alanyl-D-glutamate--2,6-diaminopimelate ligase [Arthrobacter mobilis]|uniref:UDP-N-acetylmuramyl-tripeptide synthetase n=1 Tax=Arthrobacter mobilis TaxID=2724944 RepID=A0A7X6HFW1_9MICC|nr:UDP-N-acetylmuramoyl-L-alanyl-D-glutamate--2,6-diaminopimelate ligase [Arthrobacter mobilis]NKX54947.1 UDP-N-acetylmuramoyl-L-alanyl-D-glutamate--2,6-diaminopimelate ligase [Arthrobacter mobilis]